VRPSKKFVAQSSGLSITVKTSSANMKIAGKKTSLPPRGGRDATQASARALDLFDSGSSAFDGEPAAPVPPQEISYSEEYSKECSKALWALCCER
jgi:hypothetical protein